MKIYQVYVCGIWLLVGLAAVGFWYFKPRQAATAQIATAHADRVAVYEAFPLDELPKLSWHKIKIDDELADGLFCADGSYAAHVVDSRRGWWELWQSDKKIHSFASAAFATSAAEKFCERGKGEKYQW